MSILAAIYFSVSLPAHRMIQAHPLAETSAPAALSRHTEAAYAPTPQHLTITTDHLVTSDQMHLRSSDGGSSTDMSMTGSESDDGGSTTDPIIDLTLERLQSLHAHGTAPKKNLTEYAKRGISTSRIKQAVLRPSCHCACKMPIKLLYKLCLAFWTLGKPTQDSLLWGIQHESGKQKKKRWYMGGHSDFGQHGIQKNICNIHTQHKHCKGLVALHGSIRFAGYPVCREAWVHFLGVGKHRIGRTRHCFQGRDLRSISGHGGNLSQIFGDDKMQILRFFPLN